MTSDASFTRPRALALAALAGIFAAFLFLAWGKGPDADGAVVSATGKWTCSMCPQFILPEPGKCPKCFMDLIPLAEGALGGGRLELILSPEAARLAGIETVVAEAHEEGYARYLAPTDGEPRRPTLAIPATAVLENLGRHFVFTESDDGENLSFTMREITLAGRSPGAVLVASGIDEGEAVAASGAFRIDSALQILGKVSLANLPDGELADADEADLEPYQPAERSDADIRAAGVSVDDWYDRYERLRAALARDDSSGARASARDLAGVLGALPPAAADGELAPLWEELSRSAQFLSAADSLDAQRDFFEKVSAGMVLLARKFGAPEGGLNLVFCPMAFGGAGAYWLQPQETVDNPYHGLEMPLCGWAVETIDE